MRTNSRVGIDDNGRQGCEMKHIRIICYVILVVATIIRFSSNKSNSPILESGENDERVRYAFLEDSPDTELYSNNVNVIETEDNMIYTSYVTGQYMGRRRYSKEDDD